MIPYDPVYGRIYPVPSRRRFFRSLYGYGYGGTRNRIGTVRIRPYPVYGTVLSTRACAPLNMLLILRFLLTCGPIFQIANSVSYPGFISRGVAFPNKSYRTRDVRKVQGAGYTCHAFSRDEHGERAAIND